MQPYQRIILVLALSISPHLVEAQCLTDICLKNAHGRNICLSEYAGRSIFVDFWAAWCPKCRSAFKWYQSQPVKNSDHAPVVVLINLDPDRQDATDFIEDVGAHGLILYDPEGKTAEACALASIPAAILLDSHGKEIRRWYGFSEAIQDELSQLFRGDKGDNN